MQDMRTSKYQKEIYETLESRHGAFSANSLHRLLPHINLVTIYRNLEKLHQEKRVRKMFLTGGEAIYEADQEAHHHAVCDSCQKIIHFHTEDQKIKKILNISEFEIEDIEIIVRGRCEPHSR